ncbi:MAG: hypothetical protein ABUK01_17475, partial [Leptospirales bacterium]
MSALLVLVYAAVTAIILAGIKFIFGIDYLEFWPRTILGIIGLFFMLIMHVYSIRKRKKGWGIFKKSGLKLSSYLTWHIFTATIGVTVIFFHAIGTYNNVLVWISFFSMFIVWQSGFVGRYIFVKIPKDTTGLLKEKDRVSENIEESNNELISIMVKNFESEKSRDFFMEYLTNYSNSLRSLHKRHDESISRFFQNFAQILKAWKLYRENTKLLSGELVKKSELSEVDKKTLSAH